MSLCIDVDLERAMFGSDPSSERAIVRQRSLRDANYFPQGVQNVGSFHGLTVHEDVARVTSLSSQGQNETQNGIQLPASSVKQNPPQTAGNIAHPRDGSYCPGEIFGDPSRQMWTLSLSEFEKYDREIIERWKDDTNGVLVFTGLFSATVAAFVIEGYKMLSIGSGDQTVALLTLMSQQLTGISNGAVLSPPLPLDSSPSNLPAAIRVNIMWLLSLSISITCALLATLIQQWVRRYMALSYHHDMPHERARVRTYLFTGMEQFRMKHAVEAIPILLHVSVFLFFTGLVDFFLLFNKTVAWVFIGWVGLFVSIYTAMTVIPNVFFNCPYRTPFSGLFWRLMHMLSIFALVLTDSLAIALHAFLTYILGGIYRGASTSIRSLPQKEKLVKQITAHRHRFNEGLQRCVVSSAIDPSSSVDKEALIWTLTQLDEDQEVESFVSRIPGFFDSRIVPKASATMLGLMDPSLSGGDSVLAVRLRGLLKTCLPTTSGLDPGLRKTRLYVCLTAMWYYVKAYNQSGTEGVPMSKYFRMLFTDQDDMNILLADEDMRAKVVVLCMGSLLVARIMEEIRGHTENPQVSDGELVFLKKALGPLWRLDLANHKSTELTNLDSMMSELEKVADQHLPQGETLGPEVIDTMNILAEDVLESISSRSSAESQGFDILILEHARRTLERCVSLSKQCGAEGHLGGLIKNDALDSLAKMLGELNTKLEHHAASHPHSQPHIEIPDEGIQLTANEDNHPPLQMTLPSATTAPLSVNKDLLTSTLKELGEDDEFEFFVTRIPAFFASGVISDTSTMLDLMAPSDGSDPTFALRLHKLLKTCLPGKSSLSPNSRIHRLHACLAAIWSYSRAYSRPEYRKISVPEHFQNLLTDPNDMDILLTDEDACARLLALCINSLLFIRVLEEIRHPKDDPRISEGQLTFLNRSLGCSWQLDLHIDNPGPVELTNLVAMLDTIKTIAHQEASPVDKLSREISETLDILVKGALESLSEDLPLERWGSTASAIEQSGEMLRRRLSSLKQLSLNSRLESILKNASFDMLVEKLDGLSAKLAPPKSPYRIFHAQSPPHTTAQSYSIEDMQSVNESLAPTIEDRASRPPVEDVFGLDGQHLSIPEPTLYGGQRHSPVSVPLGYQPY